MKIQAILTRRKQIVWEAARVPPILVEAKPNADSWSTRMNVRVTGGPP
jgi:hypothetical protein